MSEKTIGIIDYGMGNLGSVSCALDRLGIKNIFVQKEKELADCDRIIIPGVGSFNAAMNNIRMLGLESGIKNFAAQGKPVLGICLGMQVLFMQGTEGGITRGLGLLKGTVEKLAFAPKLPHTGWNNVLSLKESRLLKGIKNNSWFYFVHSFACKPALQDCILSVTEYGKQFVSIVEYKNIFGVQFHPEKSGRTDAILLNNFCKMML